MDDDKKPCGRKADWVVIGDVFHGGEDFVVTCRECYTKGMGRFANEHDDLVPAWIFREDVGRELMCGDEEGGLSNAFYAATKDVEDVPYMRPEFHRWVLYRRLTDRFQRIAIDRRLQRLDSTVKILTSIVVLASAAFLAESAEKRLPWPKWSWGVVFVVAWVVLDRLIRLGRFTKRAKIPPAPEAPPYRPDSYV